MSLLCRLACAVLKTAQKLVSDSWAVIQHIWSRGTRPVRLLMAAGSALVGSGCAHMVVYAMKGGGWSGPLSWRKPILFGISGGLMTISVAWLLLVGSLGQVADDVFAALFAAAILVEVGLITLQCWRRVPSHFNKATPLDAAIFHTIDGLIFLITALLIAMTFRSFGSLDLSADMALAARLGMGFLLLACGLGAWTLRYGMKRVKAGKSPEVYGKAGVPKFAHGMPIHAIQQLPVLAFLLRFGGLPTPKRTCLVASSGVGMLGLTAYSLWQTLAGRARFETTPQSGLLLGTSSVLFLGPFFLSGAFAIKKEFVRLDES